ncbi:GNAT family N-acetyltransferase [Streptomyces sp. NPDC005803]|uniref:GNAT family N-acetyltransferase n=1 Tax=Streptomyces sp. NPDC005803 TaxID=3154297 RepID=UPI0033E1BA37
MDGSMQLRQVSRHLANAREYWLGYGAQKQRRKDFFLFRSGVADAQLNGVVSFGGARVAEELPEIEQALSGLPWLWWVGPDSDDTTAADLADHGYEEIGSMPVMAIALDSVRSVPPPAGLEIRKVKCAADLTDWVHCYTAAFGIQAPPEDIERLESARSETSDILVRFSGYVDGRLVGTAALYHHEEIAGIYVVGTLKEYRGRGIGAALTAAALNEGRERGMRTGSLQASRMGTPVYERMGFEEVARYRLFMKG